MDKLKGNLLKVLVLVSIFLFISYFTNIKRMDSQVHTEYTYMSINEAILATANTTQNGQANNILNDIQEENIAKAVRLTEEESIKAKEDKKQEENKDEEEAKAKEVVKVNEIKQNGEIADKEPVREEKEIVSRGNDIGDSRTKANVNLNGYLNSYVLDVIKTYTTGDYPYLLNNDYQNYNGVTENIYYNGELLLKAHPSGTKYSHCTGITFEVFFKAMQNRNRDYGISIDNFNGMTKNDLNNFMLLWYVATGPKSQSNLAIAIEKYGIGKRITNLEEVKAGDFLDFSRENNTGHTVVFINWIREGGKIIGLKYWSSQESTKGIAYKEEYFNIRNGDGKKYGNVIMDDLHIARVSPINEYKSYR